MSREAWIEEVAREVARYRSGGMRLAADARRWSIQSEDDAEAIQERAAQILGEPVAGWKVGAPDAAGQRRLGLRKPFSGRVFARSLARSPALLTPKLLPGCMVESELAFLMGVDLPPREPPYTRAEVKSAIVACHPAFEIIDFAWASVQGLTALDFIADNGACAGIVVGEALTRWTDVEIAGLAVELHIDGRQAVRGSVAKTLDELIDIVAWLANDLSRRAIGLEAGQFVLTGSWTGMCGLGGGQRAHARFGALGEVEAALRLPS